MKIIHFWPATLIIMFLTAFQAHAETMIVEKKVFTTTNFTTFNGDIIPEVNVGWESYGELNEDKSNVVLIAHYFSGTSNAAGKYSKDDAAPGYWDAIIGPGKAIDTDKYFVISTDTLVNAMVNNPHVVTTGPASTNPETGKPYGLDFPVVTIRDFVNVQKELLESLGISNIHTVIGASMGSIQAIEWASAYPDWVDRVVSVIGMVQSDAWFTLAIEQWGMPIRLDPNWNNGDYYDSEPPLEGLTQALMMITLQAMHPKAINQMHPAHSPLEPDPLHDINSHHAVVNWLREQAGQRAAELDANHVLYLIRACQLFLSGHQNSLREGLESVDAKTLFLPAATDILLFPYMAELGHNLLQELGANSEYLEIQGNMGHLDGVYSVQQHAETLREFLAN